MSVAKTTTTCPYCKESIVEGASKCKHCHSDLAALRKKKPSIFARYNTFKYGFFMGALTLATLILVVYFKFFYH